MDAGKGENTYVFDKVAMSEIVVFAPAVAGG
jgi:hypothetical protein